MTSSPPPHLVQSVLQPRYGGTEVLELTRATAPAPAPHEVSLRVRAAAIDRGTWHVLTGLPRLARLALGLRRPRQTVPGLDVSGTVVEVGADVAEFAPGDLVFGIARGSLTEVARAEARKLALAPALLPLADAAALGVSGLTALQALDAAHVDAGHRVLVIGASGGVGHFAVQLAVARGAEVVGVCSAAKAGDVRGWGASRVIDHATEDVTTLAETFDAVIDIAATRPFRQLRKLLTSTGTYVFVGAETGGRWTGGYLRPARAMLRYRWSRRPFVMLVAQETGADLARLAELVESGAVRPHVHTTHPLVDIADALEELDSGRVVGKVLVRIETESTDG